jgi:hypothetical protein
MQKCIRLFQDLQNDNVVMNDLVNDNEHFIKMVTKSIKREFEPIRITILNLFIKYNTDIKSLLWVDWKWSDSTKNHYKLIKNNSRYEFRSQGLDSHCSS